MAQDRPDMQEAFRLLGVAPDASPGTIRAAWRAMVRAYHPDQYLGDKDAASRRLAELNAAFDLVGAATPKARSKSPHTRSNAQTARHARDWEGRRRAAHRRSEVEARRQADEQRRTEAQAQRRARAKATQHHKQASGSARVPSAAEHGFGAALTVLTPRKRSRLLGFA